jgi:hypothetical protein
VCRGHSPRGEMVECSGTASTPPWTMSRMRSGNMGLFNVDDWFIDLPPANVVSILRCVLISTRLGKSVRTPLAIRLSCANMSGGARICRLGWRGRIAMGNDPGRRESAALECASLPSPQAHRYTEHSVDYRLGRTSRLRSTFSEHTQRSPLESLMVAYQCEARR